jgi:uncharacterized protein
MGTYDHNSLVMRVKEYKHKAKVLRQIHSNKLWWTELKGAALDYGTLIASLFLAYFSVVGVEKLHNMFFKGLFDPEKAQFAFNTIVFVVLFFSFMQIAMKLGEKKVNCLNAVKTLTHFITDLDDILLLKDSSSSDCERHIYQLNQGYANLTSDLPSSNDADWRKAKKQIDEKSKS